MQGQMVHLVVVSEQRLLDERLSFGHVGLFA